MTRPKKTRINKDRSEVTDSGPRTRDLVECNCLLHCDGSKLVDPRTFKRHQEEVAQFQIIASGSQSSPQLKGGRNKPDSAESLPDEGGKRRIREIEYSSDDDDDDDDELPLSDSERMPERSGRRNHNSKILDDMILDDDDRDNSLTDGSLTKSDGNGS